MQRGHVYVLSNPCLPKDCLKIGLTAHSPQKRAAELSRMSAIPQPFRLEHFVDVQNVKAAERRVHLLLDERRISATKEFFDVPLGEARAICDRILEYESVDGAPSNRFYMHHDLAGASYLPDDTLITRKLIYLMISATNNNSPLDHIARTQRYVADGFLSVEQVAEFFETKRRAAVAELKRLRDNATQLSCQPYRKDKINPVFSFYRYKGGHAAWKFSPAFRRYFYNFPTSLGLGKNFPWIVG